MDSPTDIISLDLYIREFVAKNSFFLLLSYNLLKGIARATPWATDDKIVQILSGLVPYIKNGKQKEK